MSNRKNKKKSSDLLPENCQLEICGASGFGDLMAAAIDPTDNPHGYKIYVLENKKIKPALAEGDRFIARLSRKNDTWWAKPLARTMTAGVALEQIYGVIVEKNGLFYLRSAERNSRMDYLLDKLGSSRVGDFVKVALIGEKKFKQAKIIKNYGRFNIAKSTGLFILEKYKINDSFPDAVVKEASCCPEYHLQGREDLTALPLVTIDGDDSKDFDDAVYAEKTPGGFRLIVAIADVAYYVRPGSELDREAYRRGNSVYLPGMVIPMLPEALSNDLCSLRPKEKRPCLACLMDIDNDGNICRFDFKRAVMKSAARLTYREVQRAFEGTHSLQTMGLFKTVIQPLYEAYFALSKARKKRGTLELDPTEISIKVDNDGHILSLGPAEHFASHEIIEEFMIAANVSAAKRLEQTELPIMFRIHEKPLEEKLKDIEPLLHGLHLKLPDYPALQPGHFNHILEECRRHNLGSGINNLVLRLQCQAKYTPENVGHFGLALSDYVHFTSPIRRYADLLIHRALIKGCGMPDGGELESGADVPQFKEIGEHLCNTERTAVQAERDTLSRYLSAYLEPSIGAKFETKITGLTTAGIFVAIDSLGAEGLIPMHTLPSDKYQFSAGGNEMVGAKTGRRFMMGDRLIACLTEASPISGTLAFKLVESTEDEIRSAGKKQSSPKKSRRKAKQKLSKKERKEKIKQNNHQAEQKHNDE